MEVDSDDQHGARRETMPHQQVGERPRWTVEPMSEGKIRYVSENVGRLIVLVDWDKGGSSVLFPEEVELLDAA